MARSISGGFSGRVKARRWPYGDGGRKQRRMTRDDFNAFCASLPATTHVVQWGGADVWKIGGQVFAIGWDEGDSCAVTFKAGDFAFEILGDAPGLRPAPYLASRGLKWIQNHATPGLDDEELRAYLRRSYDMVAADLPKKTRKTLGLADPPA